MKKSKRPIGVSITHRVILRLARECVDNNALFPPYWTIAISLGVSNKAIGQAIYTLRRQGRLKTELIWGGSQRLKVLEVERAKE